MKNYLVILINGVHLNIDATSKEAALNSLHESERMWVQEVVEL